MEAAGDAEDAQLIKGGATMTMRPGDYFFVPAGTPHQMKVAPGQRIRFIAFKTHR